jgi:Mrp family chromosome partitioning ATPase
MATMISVFLITVMVTSLAAGFVEWRCHRASTPNPEARHGIPVLGTIRASMRGHEADETVHSIGSVVLHRARTAGLRVVMTASAMADEAGSELARRLALRLAATGHRTLLIDARPQAPSLHQHFHVPLAPGWSETLCQDVALSDAIRSSPIENLSLLPAGEPSDRVASALAQGYPTEALARKLREQFDLIVVEAGPILMTDTALQIGPYVDGVILAVQTGESPIAQARSAREKLALLQIPILGAVEYSDS